MPDVAATWTLIDRHCSYRDGAIEIDKRASYHIPTMAFPIKTCAVCGEEFELKPDKPGFANRCPECSESDESGAATSTRMDAESLKTTREGNAARREAMRNLLYRKDS